MDDKDLMMDIMKKDMELIADYAAALQALTDYLLEGVHENVIVHLTLSEIIKLAEVDN